ncbi:MAG TPA: hypothetical protein VIR01_13120 [Pyrinomonadaceae bacterium]
MFKTVFGAGLSATTAAPRQPAIFVLDIWTRSYVISSCYGDEKLRVRYDVLPGPGTSNSRCPMNYFRDVSKLHDLLAVLYRDVPTEARRATLARFLEEWGFTPEQASLFASTVLCRDAEGSAD